MTASNSTLYSFISCLLDTGSLINPDFTRHHHRVAYLVHVIGSIYGLPKKELSQSVCAALVHDIGAVGNQQSFRDNDYDHKNTEAHCIMGQKLLSLWGPLSPYSQLIRSRY